MRSLNRGLLIGITGALVASAALFVANRVRTSRRQRPASRPVLDRSRRSSDSPPASATGDGGSSPDNG